MSSLSVVGIDLAKARFQLHGADERGKTLFRRSEARGKVLEFLANKTKCTVALEACAASHYWGRKIQELGHRVVIIPAQFVRPFVKANKSDPADAEAIAEAAGRPNIHFVPIKSAEQLDMQALHRVRERLVGNRTALCNQIRALLVENGIYASQGVHVVAALAADVAAGKFNEVLSHVCRTTIADLHVELVDLEERIEVINHRIAATSASTQACQRLETIPGVGPVTSTAIVAAVADPSVFKNGRHFAAWLGLVPRHEGTGGKNRLLGISKRGDGYIRKLLIQGAHAALNQVQRKTDRLSSWSKQVLERRGRSKAAVALANKNARIIWRLLASEGTFDPSRLSAAVASA